MPEWLQILTALLAPSIALAVVVLGIFQWRTAHQKVVLDLFDRRLKLFYAVVDSIGPIMAHGAVSAPDGEDRMRPYLLAGRDARFLFGRDVNDYLEQLRKTLIGMHLSESMMKTHDKDHASWVRKQSEAMHQIMEFYDKFPELCDPYLKMDQKGVRSPLRWLKDSLGQTRAHPISRPPKANKD